MIIIVATRMRSSRKGEGVWGGMMESHTCGETHGEGRGGGGGGAVGEGQAKKRNTKGSIQEPESTCKNSGN